MTSLQKLPNLKICCESTKSSEIKFIDVSDPEDVFPYQCYCKLEDCECGCSGITLQDIEILFQSLGVRDRDSAIRSGVRLNAIHVWGTADLSTDDILGYFGEYNPTSIEWINDDSCNVVFPRESIAFRALQNLSEPYENTESGSDEESVKEEEEEEEDNLVEMILSRAGEMPLVDYDEAAEERSERKVKRRTNATRESWRRAVGVPDKSELLLLRYAKADDRKTVGAERKSQYYRLHGNPNFGGLPGIITESYRRRLRQTRQMSPGSENYRSVNMDHRAAVSYSELYNSGDEEMKSKEVEEERPRVEGKRHASAMRMRMKADEEEERTSGRGSKYERVHDRLGTRPHSNVRSRLTARSSDLRTVLSRRRDRSPLRSGSGDRPRQRDRLAQEEEGDRLPGSFVMRRRRNFYHHDDRSRPKDRDRRRRSRSSD